MLYDTCDGLGEEGKGGRRGGEQRGGAVKIFMPTWEEKKNTAD